MAVNGIFELFVLKRIKDRQKTNSRDTDVGQGKGDTRNCIRPSYKET